MAEMTDREIMQAILDKVMSLDEKVGSLDEKFGFLDEKVDSLDEKVDSLDEKVDSLDEKVDSLDKKVNSLEQDMQSVKKTCSKVENDLIPKVQVLLENHSDLVTKIAVSNNVQERVNALEFDVKVIKSLLNNQMS